eukprot:TRINITY_DN8968_c0_g1_i1.p1 TRINITY_DN8968_c0_g1~~TRINITY_DN8968_c0_g1_i1.p1  ORF type:complete len:118 (+),score=36.16 TRINITY_DN8968_c0_g1_i1:66-419(+)
MSAVAATPSWVLIPEEVDEHPPACEPSQMKIDECLDGLKEEIIRQEEDKYLQELEEEEAFLEAMESDDDDSSTPPSTPPDSDEEEEEDNEPRSQVLIEHLRPVLSIAAQFQSDKILG